MIRKHVTEKFSATYKKFVWIEIRVSTYRKY